MRRWFLSRFYRLGLGGWFGPPTRYVDKEPTDSEIVGDEVVHVVDVGDAQTATALSGDVQLRSEVDP